MRCLVACECSGVVRDALAALGHEAWSCDLLPSERPGQHIQGDVLQHLEGWDLIIAHPPCTFLCNSSVHLLTSKRPQEANRPQEMREGALFFKAILEAICPRLAVENPVMHKYAVAIIGRKQDQTVQPYEFGHNAKKRTGFWLRGLPLLRKTGPFVAPRMVNGKPRWANQTDGGQNKLGPSPTRWMERSRTYEGIARAMAAQWTADF